MSWSKYLFITLLLAFSSSCKNTNQQQGDSVTELINPAPAPLIDAFELLDEIESNPHLAIIDFRKKEDYKKGHLPGAINIWRSDIEDISYPYKGMMATKETIEELFSKLGIENRDTLIVYDKHGGYDAARLWWILMNYDFNAVRILNGGINEWGAIGGKIETTTTAHLPSIFTLPKTNGMEYFIDLETFKTEQKKEQPPLIVDARTSDEYSGKRLKSGAKRAGRIPNSILMDWADAVEYHGYGKFRSIDELESLYSKMGVDKDHPIVTYCHTGVRSSHTTFVLTQLLGYTNVKNYDGSWSEWSHFEDLPIEKDSITVILQ